MGKWIQQLDYKLALIQIKFPGISQDKPMSNNLLTLNFDILVQTINISMWANALIAVFDSLNIPNSF